MGNEIHKEKGNVKKYLIIFFLFLIVIISVIISNWYLFFSSYDNFLDLENNNQTFMSTKEGEMELVVSSCISEKMNRSDIMPFLEGKIELCDTKESKYLCMLNYYYFNMLSGFYFNNCTDIDNQEAKINCEILMNKDISMCEKMNFSDRGNQVICMAVISDDVSVCGQLSDLVEQKMCKNMVYIHGGAISKNMNECNNILEIDKEYEYTWFDSQKQQCIFIVMKNLSFFKQKMEEHCLNDHLVEALDSSLCVSILKSKNEIENCIERVNGIFLCINKSDSKSCINNIIDIKTFCREVTNLGYVSEGGLYYNKYKFLKENSNICHSEL